MTLPTTGPAMGERIAESQRRHAEALEMGGPLAVGKHRASGRLPVRERIALLLDEGSWFETGALAQPERRTDKKVPGDGVVTGFGRVDGRTVGLIGIDATVLAGTTARGVDRGETGYGVEAVAMLYATRDAAEGIAAYTERREPRFEGR